MEFSIDEILMTLLVGAVTSLSLMSVLFLFLDSKVKIQWIGRVFRFVLFEQQPYLKNRQADDAADSPSHSLFIGLLLVACMFGLGVATEMASDSLNEKDTRASQIRQWLDVPSDSDIRVKSFLRVGGSEVDNGRPYDQLRRLYTDYRACEGVNWKKGDPCGLVATRVTSAYYYAKNSVFSKENYFEELKDLQGRIDFTRGMAFALGVFGIILSFGFVMALAAEVIDRLVRSFPLMLGPRFGTWWTGKLGGGDGFVSHVKNLSEIRLALLAALSFGASWSALNAWAELEYTYDNRVFGYFLCDQCMGLETPSEWKTAQSAAETGRISDSVYRVFGGSAGHFEPSAVASLGLVEGKNLFVVGSDKDSNRLYIFELDDDGNLEHRRDLPLVRQDDDTLLKIEAIALTDDGTVNKRPTSIFIAARKLSAPGKEGEKTLVYQAPFPRQLDENADTTLRLTPVKGSEKTCDAILADRKVLKTERCEIEGLAYLDKPGQRRLVIGVRSVGEVGLEWRPLLGLAILPLVEGAVPKVIHSGAFPNSGDPQCAMDSEDGYADGKTMVSGHGISDLTPFPTLDTKKSELLMLSSYEATPSCKREEDKDDKNSNLLIREVQGALWRIPLATLDDRTTFAAWLRTAEPVVRLAHKPEGIAVLAPETNTALIIFDDDASRKSVDRAPDTFPLKQSESVFTVLKLDSKL